MKKIIIVLFILLSISLVACSNEITSASTTSIETRLLDSYQKNTYILDVFLDDDLDKLIVEGEIIYINDKEDFDEIYLTMFPNAYNRDSQTEDNVVFDYLRVDENDYNVTFSGTDMTSIHLDLVETLEVNKNHRIEFKYEFNYWDFGRIANLGDYFITMFFYPYVNVYDEFGWNIEPYTFTGESYYNEIGDYYVTLNVSQDLLVACSGEVIEEVNLDSDRLEISYELINARDFSFSASSLYINYIRVVDDIIFEIYSISPLYNDEIELSFDTLEQAYSVYNELIGVHDYTHFTLELGYIYGMESSGLIYCSREISEGTIVHELVHQWFYSSIGNDQSDFSFIDESLTTFVTGLYFEEIYGPAGKEQYFQIRDSYRPDLIDHFNASLGTTMLRKVDEYEDEYGYIIYYHGVTLIKYYIDNYLDGNYDMFKMFMGVYYDTYKYDEVSLHEFLTLLEETTQVEETYEWFMFMLNEFQDVDNPLPTI